MTTTEEIIVSGENFIERQITVCLQQDDIKRMQGSAYSRGYERGWVIGFIEGLAVIGIGAFCIWLALRY